MVHSIRRYLRILSVLVREDMKTKLSSRADFALIVLGITAYSLASVFTIVLIYQHTDNIVGFSRGSLIFMQGFMMVSFSFQSAFMNYQWWLELWTRDGSVLKYYLRPLHPIAQLSLEGFHPQGIAMFVFGMAYCIIGLADSPERLPGVPLALAFIVFMALSAAVYLAINLTVASAAFWIRYPYAITATVSRVIDLAKFPQDLFPTGVRVAFVSVFPLAFISYYPTLAITEGHGIGYPLLWMSLAAVISIGFMLKMWKWGMKAYEGAGG